MSERRVLSVSLGSARRDHRTVVTLQDRSFVVERLGSDGSIDRAVALLQQYDGVVDAFGLGGIDVLLAVGTERYAMRDGLRLLRAVRQTPIVDGSGLKQTLERRAVAFLQQRLGITLAGTKVLMVSALDRFGMAQAFVAAGAQVLFGDFIFALDLDQPVRDLHTFEEMARRYLPDACKLPFQFFYPTGKAQERPPQPKYPAYYEEADIIAGDFHFLRRYLPDRLPGAMIVTNTVTQQDLADLERRGVASVVTTTPEMGGRSFGSNVLEAMLIATQGAHPLPDWVENATPGALPPGSAALGLANEQYDALIAMYAIEPRVVRFA